MAARIVAETVAHLTWHPCFRYILLLLHDHDTPPFLGNQVLHDLYEL